MQYKVFIFCLKTFRKIESLISMRKVCQIWLIIWTIQSRPYRFVSGLLVSNKWIFLRSLVFFQSLKISFVIWGDRPLRYLWASIMRNSRHFGGYFISIDQKCAKVLDITFMSKAQKFLMYVIQSMKSFLWTKHPD